MQSDTIVPDTLNILDWDRFGYVHNNPLRYIDPSGHDRDCGINDPYCNSLKHEMAKSDWPKQLDFKKYVAAKDSYEYYKKNPEKGITADINSDDSFMYASIYSEYVADEWYQPYGLQNVIYEIDNARENKDSLKFWTLLFWGNIQVEFENGRFFGSGIDFPQYTQYSVAKNSYQMQYNWTLGKHHGAQSWANKMQTRGWNPELIDQTINTGQAFPAINLVNPGNKATRYYLDGVGNVVFDEDTREVIMIYGKWMNIMK